MHDSTPTAPAADRVLLRPREAARALGCSERSLHNWIHQEGLPFVRIGRSLRFRPEALEAWAAAHERGGADR